MLDVDPLGLDKMDRLFLLTLIDSFNGGPVGIETLAAALHEEKDTLEDVYEPFLMQRGFIQRTPRGREATVKAYEYFNRSVSPDRRGGKGGGESIFGPARQGELFSKS
jgi:Holliday junction DNA helicase RuvB